MNRTGNCYLKRLALVFVCALSVRIAVVAIHCSSDAIEQHDAHSELVWVARNLVAGRGFSSPFGPGDSPTAWFSPALPILWSFVMRAVGEGDTFLAIILYLNALGSALSVVVYALILKGLVAPGKLRPRAFMMATGVLCLWPPALMLTTYTWYYCWQELGIALLFLALQRWHVSEFNLRASLCVGCCAALAKKATRSTKPSPGGRPASAQRSRASRASRSPRRHGPSRSRTAARMRTGQN